MMSIKNRNMVLVAGHSHIESLRRASECDGAQGVGHVLEFLQFREMPIADSHENRREIIDEYGRLAEAADAIVLCIQGNQHNVLGLPAGIEFSLAMEEVGRRTSGTLNSWLNLLLPATSKRVALLLAPPPIEAEADLWQFRGFRNKFAGKPLRASAERLVLWNRQKQVTEEIADNRGIDVIHLPDSVFSPTGFLAHDCYGNDPTHGNLAYGERVIGSVLEYFSDLQHRAGTGKAESKSHFYVGLPNYAYWRQSISELPEDAVDPVASVKFVVTRDDKVAAAGSCFAQHILKRLHTHSFNCLVTESAHDDNRDVEPPVDFSARFGNIYTSRQLLQLFERAFGEFQPITRAWPRRDGRFCDPFRPTVEADGFPSELAVVAAAEHHLSCVRKMFQELDVFVFTLGLTECWRSRSDQAVYPVAPGVAGGEYDPSEHELVNLRVQDVVEDLETFFAKLKAVNPQARAILTVSPVPLAATAVDRHVLVSTVHSKSVLRVAAGEVADAHSFVDYFPSYEIITGPHARGSYFGSDRRGVTERGVDHVMKVFFSRMTDANVPVLDRRLIQSSDQLREMESLAEASCDEELLVKDRGRV